MDIKVEHRPDQSRFQAVVDGQTCVIDYALQNGVMAVTHTGVPPPVEGRGIAGQLMKALLDQAKNDGVKVEPLCTYARAYMERHPETAELLA